MASISTDPNGNRTIQFVGTDKKRRSTRLGKTPMKAAQSIATKVESILSHQITRQPLEFEIAHWIANLDEVMSEKLVKVGLNDRKAPATIATVGSFLDAYLERRANDVKEGTFVFYGRTVRNLKGFFTEGKPLADIHAGDADDFHRHFLRVPSEPLLLRWQDVDTVD